MYLYSFIYEEFNLLRAEYFKFDPPMLGSAWGRSRCNCRSRMLYADAIRRYLSALVIQLVNLSDGT